MGEPPLPGPLLHKYVEEREKGKAAQIVRCALDAVRPKNPLEIRPEKL
jgi:hypothetical protein